jgi:CheY-like chemotaxis protein
MLFFTTREAGEGTGLGLSITSSLVKELDGTIDIESKVEAGAKFTLTFPKYFNQEECSAKKLTRTSFKGLKGHVLVVDDEEPLREILTILLETFGLTVEQAEDGESALSKIKSKKYDLVITDIKMPKMNGDQLIKEMVKSGYLEKLQVIVITGCIDKDIFSQDSLLSDLQIGIIQKPFKNEEVYKKLAECLKEKNRSKYSSLT